MPATPPPDPNVFQWLYENIWAPVIAIAGTPLMMIFKGMGRKMRELERDKLSIDVFQQHLADNRLQRKEMRNDIERIFVKMDDISAAHTKLAQDLLKAIYDTAERRSSPRQNG